jgi:hypothetical protein
VTVHGSASASCHLHTIAIVGRLEPQMPRTWIWMQIAIVVFVLIGMIVAITKLA